MTEGCRIFPVRGFRVVDIHAFISKARFQTISRTFESKWEISIIPITVNTVLLILDGAVISTKASVYLGPTISRGSKITI